MRNLVNNKQMTNNCCCELSTWTTCSVIKTLYAWQEYQISCYNAIIDGKSIASFITSGRLLNEEKPRSLTGCRRVRIRCERFHRSQWVTITRRLSLMAPTERILADVPFPRSRLNLSRMRRVSDWARRLTQSPPRTIVYSPSAQNSNFGVTLTHLWVLSATTLLTNPLLVLSSNG